MKYLSCEANEISDLALYLLTKEDTVFPKYDCTYNTPVNIWKKNTSEVLNI